MSEAGFELRPMGISGILDRSFRLYRDNFLTFFGILLVVQASIYVVQQTVALASSEAALTVIGLIGLVITPLSQGALTLAVSERFLGRTVSVGASYRRILPRLKTLIWAGVLVLFAVAIGFVLLIVPGIYLMFAFILTSVVVVLEGKKARAAMSRSRELMRKKTEKGFFKANGARAAIIFFIVLCQQVAIAGMMGVLYAVLGPSQTGDAPVHMPWATQAFVGGVEMLMQAAVAPFYTIAIILLYYDIRIRFEGFDLEMMAQSLGQPAVAEGAVLANP